MIPWCGTPRVVVVDRVGMVRGRLHSKVNRQIEELEENK